MISSLAIVLTCASLSVSNPATLLTASTLSISASQLGAGWSGPTGLVVDDLEHPPALTGDEKVMVAGMLKQARSVGVRSLADFTYHKKGSTEIVTVRVFIFESEQQCKQWMNTKYQFAGWETKYKKLVDADYYGLDSLEMSKRIGAIGNVWITVGTVSETDDYLRVMALYVTAIKKSINKTAEPTPAADGQKAARR